MNQIHKSLIINLKSLIRWATATRLRKILSSILAILVFLTAIRYLFLPAKEVQAADIHLGFDEGYGTSSAVNDSNGTISAGSITNATWKQEDLCKVGKCLYFDGSGDYVSFADDTNLDFGAGNTFTISGWFRTPDITSGQRTLVAKANSTAGYKVYMDSSGYLIFGIDDDTTWGPDDSVSTSAGSAAFDDNGWHFFSAVKNGTTSISIYVDGILYKTNNSLTATSTLSNNQSLYIGIDGDGASNGYSGFLDEIQITRTAKSQAEIAADFLGNSKSTSGVGPVAWYKMDEASWNGTASEVKDNTGNGSDGTAQGNATTTSSGKFNSAGTFDGTGDAVDLGQPSVLDITSQITLSGWFKSSASSNTQTIIGKSDDSSNFAYMLYVDTSNNARLQLSTDGTGYLEAAGTTNVVDGAWHYITGTYDNTDAHIYVDGKLEGTSEIGGDLHSAPNENVYIGAHVEGTLTDFITGTIDDVRIYDYVRTPAQILEDMLGYPPTGTSASFGPDQSYLSNGLVGYWKMDESSGDATDYSGNSITLTNNSSTTFVGGKFGNGSEYVPASTQYFSAAASGTSSYCLDGSDAAANDVYANWTDDANAFDCSTSTYAYTSTLSTNLLKAEGTDAPTSGSTITQVEARAYGAVQIPGDYIDVGIYTDGAAELISSGLSIDTGSPGWTSYTTLSTPTGGWTWQKVNDLETQMVANTALGNEVRAYEIQFRVTSSGGTISGAKSVSFWTNPDSTTNYYVSLTSGAYLTSTSGTLATTGLTNAKIYVNGVQSNTIVADQWQFVTVTFDSVDADQFYVGRVGSNYYDGTLDEIRVYNRTLSPAEITKLYNWAPGPVAHLKLDENSGSTVYDVSGNGLSGTFTNSPTWSNGKFGSAVNFSGSSQYISVSDPGANSVLDFTDGDSLTMEAWIYPRALPSTDTATVILTKGYNTGSEVADYFMDIYNNSGTYILETCWIETGTGYTCYDTGSITFPLNTWQHVAVAIPFGSASTSAVKIYYNGVLQTISCGTSPDCNLTATESNSALWIGDANSGGSIEALNGKVDDVRMYNYIRSASQVVEDMNGGHPAPGSPVGSAVARWKFDEGYGTTAYDSNINTGGAENLTLSSATSAWSNDGKFSKAFYANGSRWATRADDDDLDFTASESMSISLWMKSTLASGANPSATEYAINKPPSGATNGGYAIYANTSGQVCFGIDDDNTSFPEDSTCTSSDVYDNSWHNIVAVKNGTSSLTVYLDGQANGAPDTSISSTANTLANTSTFIVASQDTTDDTDDFNAYVDEIQVFRSAATDDQVKQLYNQGAGTVMGATSTDSSGNASWSANDEYCPPGQGSTCTPPVAHWKFDENTGTTANDSASGTYTGTIANSPPWVPGKIGTALKITDPASNSPRVDIADDSFDSLTSGTVGFWFKADDVGDNYQDFLGVTEDVADSWWEMAFDRSNNRLYVWAGGNLNNCDLEAYIPFTNNQTSWHHFAFTDDSSGNAFYLDGVKTTATYTTGTSSTDCFFADWVSTTPGTTEYALGCWLQNGSTGVCENTEMYQGLLDDVRLYDYARTPAQVAWDFNRGKPVAWYKMDETGWNTTSGEVKDSSGNGLHGTAAGNATTTTGKFNNAGTFNGSSDYVTISYDSKLNVPDSYSLSLWIYANSFPGASNYATMLHKGGDYAMELYGTSEVNCQNGTAGENLSTNANLLTATWYHLVCVQDNDAGTMTFYVNGKQIYSTSAAGSRSVGADNVGIGAAISGPSQYVDGKIDDVRIYNYPLNATQVRNLYNQNSTVQFAPLTGTP